MMQKNKQREKSSLKLIWLAIVVFFLEIVTIIGINAGLSHGWRTDWTISRYVGLETWSVVLFAVGNCFVTGLMGVYLWRLGLRLDMPKIYYIVILIMSVGLLWCSFCPTGYCDAEGTKSLISVLHELTARTMFVMMAVAILLVAAKINIDKGTRILCGIFMLYAIFCVTFGYFAKTEWFKTGLLFFESAYFLGFMGVMGMVGKKAISSRKK